MGNTHLPVVLLPYKVSESEAQKFLGSLSESASVLASVGGLAGMSILQPPPIP